MRTTFGCLVILAGLQITVPCYGQFERASNTGTAPPGRTVTGTVVNAISSVPVRRALVQIFGTSPLAVLTGPDGHFRFENVPEGQIGISVQKPGFFDARSIPGSPENRDPLVTVGSGKNDFRVNLYPAARIVGRVTDADGEPVENISIQAFSEQIFQGRKQFQPQKGAATDDDGVYRLENLQPGRFVIFANGHLFPALYWKAPPEVTRPVYYPDSRDLTSAQQIELKAGQEFRADFRLRSEAGFRVTGSARGVPDKAGVGIWFENASGHNVAFGSTNFDQSKGKLVAEGVPSGAWTLVISSYDGHDSYQARQEVVVDGADVTDVQLLLQPSVSIPVKMNHPANVAPLSAGQASVDTPLNAALISDDPFHFTSYQIQWQGSPPAAMFSSVAPGKYKLHVDNVGGECLESAWYGGVDLTRDYLVVGSGMDTEMILVNLRRDCATLRVKLQPEGHPRTAFVLIVPSSPIADPETVALAAPAMQPVDITTHLTLSPGSYQVFAFSNMDGLDYANPETMRGYSGQTITLDPGQKAELTLELIERKGN